MLQSVSRWMLATGAAAIALPGAALAQPSPSTMSVAKGQNPVIKVQANRQQLRDIRLKLRDRGFENITFPGRTAPYRVNACRDGELLELTVGRRGKVRDRKPIGICGRSERFGAGSAVRRELRQKGYRGIEVFSEGPRRTLFMACKNGEKTRIIVTRDGQIRREVRVGACDRRRRARPVDRDVRRPIGQPTNRLPRANRSDVIDQFLTRRRYSNIKVLEDDGDVVIAQACRRLRLFRIRLNMADRKVLKRKRVGWCNAPRGQRIARAPRPDFKLDSDQRIGGDKCQDAFEYLLDKDKVYFETASAEIGRASIPLLRRLARIARRCPSATIVIGGHTDSVGSDSSNQRLSEERAFSVLSYLRDNGISKDRLSAIGYGESRPVASNSDDEGRALNRRIEMLVEWEG